MVTAVAAPPRAPHSSHSDASSDEDELMFGDFCFTCGNATQGTPYCSQQCRQSDSLNPLPSPDFSPALSAVPPLIPSAKSVSSTPPSSVNNSPNSFGDLTSDQAAGEDPPRLDLPALASKFDYGGASLPIGLRYPTHFAHSYSHDLVSYPGKELRSSSFGTGGGFDPLDLTYRRKPGVPTQTIPAPLYFRQTAAVHSPALAPSSPRFSPRFSPSHGPSLFNLNVSTFALPPAVATVATVSAPPTLPPTLHCGRPGCAGKIELSLGAGSQTSSLSGTKRPAPLDADLLLSPRIRALRGGEVATIGAEEGITEAEPVDGNHHSAFACYLFFHLAEPTSPLPSFNDSPRGRSSKIAAAAPEEKRSISADSSLPARGTSTSTAHPPRFAFGGRGRPAPERTELAIETSSRPKLTPGRFIAATTDSPTHSNLASPIPSPPSSPPTLSNRGRPSARRAEVSPPAFVGPTPDPRGRSKLRGIGAVQRDYSPVRDSSNSSSRGRNAEVSNERARGSRSRSRARSPRQSSRRSERSEREEPVRGRGRREEIEEEVEDVYRRGRSTSALRRGRGREIALSGAGYGHDSP